MDTLARIFHWREPLQRRLFLGRTGRKNLEYRFQPCDVKHEHKSLLLALLRRGLLDMCLKIRSSERLCVSAYPR